MTKFILPIILITDMRNTKLFDEIMSEFLTGQLESKSMRIVLQRNINLGVGLGAVLHGVSQ